ncbi:MAG: pyridoxine 5'-phosphate synthase [Saprospiraceae bacterium]
MTKLSVNINKIALLRNSRGANLPNLIQVAQHCIEFGAEGITVHPRQDERHVRKSDIPLLKAAIEVELNIEGYPSPDFVQMVLDNHPAQVSLVPDAPSALTSDSGWDTRENLAFLKSIVSEFKSAGIRVSLFLNPYPQMVDYAYESGADRIEIYTGNYAEEFWKSPEHAISRHIATAERAQLLGLGLNAGHDLNLDNLAYYKQNVPGLLEVSIGHAIVCDALYYGLQNTIQMYLNKLR